jgi:hypothetical protein
MRKALSVEAGEFFGKGVRQQGRGSFSAGRRGGKLEVREQTAEVPRRREFKAFESGPGEKGAARVLTREMRVVIFKWFCEFAWALLVSIG